VDGLNGSKEPSTVIELFGRTEEGESMCALVHGLRPTFEISPLVAWTEGMEVPEHVLGRLAMVRTMEDVLDVSGPTMKLTDLGQRPVWTVTVRQPFVVPSLRKALSKQSWQIFSGDIPFLNRLFLDQGLGMHLALEGDIIDRRHNEDEEACLKAVRAAGGAGRYAVDCTIVCTLADLTASEPFPVPYKVFSFDLETSIAHDTVLCAAAIVEDMSNVFYKW
jgi:DNA polymerase elongation subunit (family B)